MINIIFKNIPFIKKIILIVIISLSGNYYIINYIDNKYGIDTESMVTPPQNRNHRLNKEYSLLKKDYEKLLPYQKYFTKYRFKENTLENIKNIINQLFITLKNGNIIEENIQKIIVEKDPIYINKLNINILLSNNLDELTQRKYNIILNYFLNKIFTKNIVIDNITTSYQNVNITLYKR